MTTRIEALREAKEWKQPDMAAFLGVSQPTVSNMVRGQPESGPIRRLLDHLAREIGRSDLLAENYRRPPEAAE